MGGIVTPVVNVATKANPIGWLSGGLGLAGNLIQGIINRRQQKKNLEQSNEYNRKMAEYEYSKKLEAWNMQNEYNTPKAQMQRFKDAGLNENLIYTRGDSGNAGQIANYQAPTGNFNNYPVVDLPEALSSYQDFRQKAQNYWGGKSILEQQKTKANAMKWELQDLANNFFTKWNTTQGYDPQSIGAKMMATMLEKNQADVTLANQRKQLNDFMLKFQSSGGAFFNPALQLLRMIFAR
nr:MAG: DNA pilot protein [Microvirus sp.]